MGKCKFMKPRKNGHSELSQLRTYFVHGCEVDIILSILNTPNVVSNRHNLGSGYFLLLNGKQYQEMCRLNIVSNYEQQGWCYGYYPYFKTSKTRRLCCVVFIPMYDAHISLSAVMVLLTLTLRILAYK
jgi:hypothetical protein